MEKELMEKELKEINAKLNYIIDVLPIYHGITQANLLDKHELSSELIDTRDKKLSDLIKEVKGVRNG